MMCNGLIGGLSKLRTIVFISTKGAGYEALARFIREAFWIRKFAQNLKKELPVNSFDMIFNVLIGEDNMAGNMDGRNPIFFDMSRHVDIKYQFGLTTYRKVRSDCITFEPKTWSRTYLRRM